LIDPGTAEDDQAALAVIQALGASVKKLEDGSMLIRSQGVSNSNHTNLDCGESGLSLRMFVPIAALASAKIQVSGHGSLLKRPQHFFEEVLPLLGVDVTTNNGLLPIRLTGPLIPKTITIDGTLSSQFLTGLLMAYAGASASDVSIHVNGLVSRPYIDLTLEIMERFGLVFPINNNYQSFIFNKSNPVVKPSRLTYTIEGDWSGAAFLLVAAALAGEVIIQGIDPNSKQADRQILSFAHQAQLNIEALDQSLSIQRSAIKPFEVDATNCPDLFPPLVALAVYCNGTSVIEGVSRLAHKESNRALTLQQEFAKLGVDIELVGDEMMVTGGKILQGASVHSHHDHRIAMACAVAALRAEQPVDIAVAEAINKSYPDFYQHLAALGADVTLTEQ
jgi:3-phosphoshikimate 1-carboxyvinyltransferase